MIKLNLRDRFNNWPVAVDEHFNDSTDVDVELMKWGYVHIPIDQPKNYLMYIHVSGSVILTLWRNGQSVKYFLSNEYVKSRNGTNASVSFYYSQFLFIFTAFHPQK